MWSSYLTITPSRNLPDPNDDNVNESDRILSKFHILSWMGKTCDDVVVHIISFTFSKSFFPLQNSFRKSNTKLTRYFWLTKTSNFANDIRKSLLNHFFNNSWNVFLQDIIFFRSKFFILLWDKNWHFKIREFKIKVLLGIWVHCQNWHAVLWFPSYGDDLVYDYTCGADRVMICKVNPRVNPSLRYT